MIKPIFDLIKNKNNSYNVIKHDFIYILNVSKYFKPSEYNKKIYLNVVSNDDIFKKIDCIEYELKNYVISIDKNYWNCIFISWLKNYILKLQINCVNDKILTTIKNNKNSSIYSIFDLNNVNINLKIFPKTIWNYNNTFGIWFVIDEIEIC